MLLKDVIEIDEFSDFTFRSLLSHAMKKECPHLLHDDEHISSYKTSKGRNLTGILDRDVFSSLPQLMEKDELPKVEVVLVRPSTEIVTDETGREIRCAFDAIMPSQSTVVPMRHTLGYIESSWTEEDVGELLEGYASAVHKKKYLERVGCAVPKVTEQIQQKVSSYLRYKTGVRTTK